MYIKESLVLILTKGSKKNTLNLHRIFIDNIRVQSIGKPIIQEQVNIKTDEEMKAEYPDRIL